MALNMSGMHGYEATRAIHAHCDGRKIPVVAVSADCAADGFERWAFNAGFSAFLAKPFEPEELLKIVRKVLTSAVESRRVA
jgi:CheY-like chemotaxis protein